MENTEIQVSLDFAEICKYIANTGQSDHLSPD
jgi:hypothetical protein